MAKLSLILVAATLAFAGCLHEPEHTAEPNSPSQPGGKDPGNISKNETLPLKLQLFDCAFFQSPFLSLPNDEVQLLPLPGFERNTGLVTADIKGFECDEFLLGNASLGAQKLYFELHSNVSESGVLQESYSALYVLNRLGSNNETVQRQFLLESFRNFEANLTWDSTGGTRSVGGRLQSGQGDMSCTGAHIQEDPSSSLWNWVMLAGANETHAWGFKVIVNQWADSFLVGTGASATGELLQAQWPAALQAVSGCTIHFDTQVTIEPRLWEF